MTTNDWAQVKWTEARQVAEAMGIAESGRPAEGIVPQSHYAATVASGKLETAVSFLGHALPRFEAIAWAARLVRAQSLRTKLIRRDQQALDRALRWLDDPCDEFRRDAFAASKLASEDSPERMLATAVFLSGGSMAPADLHPVTPPPHLSGRFAAAAVILAAQRSSDPSAALRDALALGEKIAAGGLTAASAA